MGRSVLAILLLVLPVCAAEAQQASQWAELLHSQTRLVRGAAQADGSIEIGVHIKLDAGWKTYWRVPGDAGMPPEFDWSRSRNVAQISLLWPAPVRFRDPFGQSIGYKDEVVFPVLVRPQDWSRTTALRLRLNYAVCKEICAPLSAELELDLTSRSIRPRHAALIAHYRAQVPRPADEVEGLQLTDVRVEAVGKGVELVIDVASDEATRPVDLFVEGPQAFYFASPRLDAHRAQDHLRFHIPVDGAESAGALVGKRLNFVLVQGEKRVAQEWRL